MVMPTTQEMTQLIMFLHATSYFLGESCRSGQMFHNFSISKPINQRSLGSLKTRKLTYFKGFDFGNPGRPFYSLRALKSGDPILFSIEKR